MVPLDESILALRAGPFLMTPGHQDITRNPAFGAKAG